MSIANREPAETRSSANGHFPGRALFRFSGAPQNSIFPDDEPPGRGAWRERRRLASQNQYREQEREDARSPGRHAWCAFASGPRQSALRTVVPPSTNPLFFLTLNKHFSPRPTAAPRRRSRAPPRPPPRLLCPHFNFEAGKRFAQSRSARFHRGILEFPPSRSRLRWRDSQTILFIDPLVVVPRTKARNSIPRLPN